MIALKDGRAELHQWDTGRILTVDSDINELHFAKTPMGRSLDVSVSDGEARVPDVLLQTPGSLHIWAFVGTPEDGYTKVSKVITVQPRNKPADYVFTPQEQLTLAGIADRVESLEKQIDGDSGKDITADSIKTALGYVPADAADVGKLEEEIADQKKALESITLGKHTDGLIYIFIGGQPVGNGLDISGGDVVEPVWGQPVTDNAVLSIAKGQTVMLGVMLDEEPTQEQTITVSSESEYLTFDKTVLTFIPENWNTMQFVAVTAINVTEDVNVSILLSNSDPMLTDTSIFVMLTADGYSVDTTIPDGAHTVTAADFTTASVYQTNYVQLSGYTGEYDNIYIPDTIEVDGVAKTPILKSEAFSGNTAIKYVRIAPGVNMSRYGAVGYEMQARKPISLPHLTLLLPLPIT